ncbi:hypothetical protein [Rhodohalobacter mucosus]|uniref:Uncharacterized protein n=1 Tax=Rhodohalobacter mucosus TaxID=2079485 RepID=A0A316TQV7_9BACT|nr:hypothetical protein [Rhodohalobacter mucosus]PWN05639.1 hypothetical protein DDZ15_13660 [Rhodohalobacter mucosus]
MPQVCRVCSHPDTKDIEKDIVANIPYTQIGEKYGLDYQVIRRHALNHLPEKLVRTVQQDAQRHSEGILDGIKSLLDRTKTIMDQAQDKGYGRLELEAIREARSTYELLAKIAAKLREYQDREKESEGYQMEQQINEGLQALSTTELKTYVALQAKIYSASPDHTFTPQVQSFIDSHMVTGDYTAEGVGTNREGEGDREPEKTRIRLRQENNTKSQGAATPPTGPDSLELEDFDLSLGSLSDEIPSVETDPAWLRKERLGLG